MLEKRVENLIGPTIEDMGFELVRVMIMGTRTPRLQVMVERGDGVGVSVDDCADVSRAISAVMDVRPLTRPRDFLRFRGRLAKIELFDAIDGRRRFQGRIRASDEDSVSLEVDGEIKVLPFADVRKSKLVLTDELLASATKEG